MNEMRDVYKMKAIEYRKRARQALVQGNVARAEDFLVLARENRLLAEQEEESRK